MVARGGVKVWVARCCPCWSFTIIVTVIVSWWVLLVVVCAAELLAGIALSVCIIWPDDVITAAP